MRSVLRLGVVLVAATFTTPAWGAATVEADFESGDVSSLQHNPDVEENTFAAIADTPTGGSGASTMAAFAVVEDWFQFESDEDDFSAETYVQFNFDTPIDAADAAFLNYYIKAELARESSGTFVTFIEENTSTGWGFSEGLSVPSCEWGYVSIPLDFGSADFTFGAADGNGISAVQIGISCDLGALDGDTFSTLLVWLDHVTLSDTEAEGELSGANAPGGDICVGEGGSEGEGEGEGESITVRPGSGFPILGEPFSLVIDLPFTPDFYSVFWNLPSGLNPAGAPCIALDVPNPGLGATVTATLRHPTTGDILPVGDFFWTTEDFESGFSGPDVVTFNPDGTVTFEVNQDLLDLGYIVMQEDEFGHFFSRIAVNDPDGTNCDFSKAIEPEFDPENLSLEFTPLEASDAGEYCVYISGEVGGDFFDDFICFTLSASSFLPEGTTLPASGLAGFALLGSALAAGGVAVIRRMRR